MPLLAASTAGCASDVYKVPLQRLGCNDTHSWLSSTVGKAQCLTSPNRQLFAQKIALLCCVC